MKKFIYLISPNKIDKNFYNSLKKVLSSNKVQYFQLRLKNQKKKKIIQVSKKIIKITKFYNVKFVINDIHNLVKIIGADGCHLGQSDGNILKIRKRLKNKVIGVTCHNSKRLAKKAKAIGASYVAFGSFYKSKLKPKAKRANTKILSWAKKKLDLPVVAIGGINNKNYMNLIKQGANYIALSSFIWDNPKLKPEKAIKVFI
ncbi:MAG: thiamine phosphate synthase [Pseudomonadota bacterium]|nr:thiamine phosphate synthase [Pseudomonadota bacterium]